MANGILHQRLQKQMRRQRLAHIRGNAHVHAQFVFEPLPHDCELQLQRFHLAVEGTICVSASEMERRSRLLNCAIMASALRGSS
jgi:hypothetical protein